MKLPLTLFVATLACAACSADVPRTTAIVREADEAGLTDEQLLGKRLFFDTTLSEPAGQACASCHAPKRAFTEPSGRGIAPGAVAGRTGTRNVPTVMYAAFTPPMEYEIENGEEVLAGGQFLDGRANSLAHQARQPFLNPREMNNTVAGVVERIMQGPNAELMRALYGDAVFGDPGAAYRKASEAIAAFEQTPRFQPFSSQYDRYRRGEATLTASETRGLRLFKDPAKGNCAACHVMDDTSPRDEDNLFTDFTFDNLGVPRNAAIADNADPAFFDLGLCKTVGAEDPGNCGAFKVPTLRNVAAKGAYMHNAVFTDLRTVVEFYVTRSTNPERWYGGPNPNDLPPEYWANVNTTEPPYDRKPGQTPRLNDEEIDDVVAFLATLTDK